MPPVQTIYEAILKIFNIKRILFNLMYLKCYNSLNYI